MVHMFVVFAITAVAALHDNNIARMHASNVTVGPLLDATEKRLVGATETAASGLDKEDFNNTDKTIKLVTGPHGEISATAADSSASFIEEEFHTALAAKQAELDQWKAKAAQQGEEIKRQAEEIKLLQTRIHEYAKNKENDESLSETGMVDGSFLQGAQGETEKQKVTLDTDMQNVTVTTSKADDYCSCSLGSKPPPHDKCRQKMPIRGCSQAPSDQCDSYFESSTFGTNYPCVKDRNKATSAAGCVADETNAESSGEYNKICYWDYQREEKTCANRGDTALSVTRAAGNYKMWSRYTARNEDIYPWPPSNRASYRLCHYQQWSGVPAENIAACDY